MTDYRIRMDRDSKKVLWENVSALMKREFGKENLTALAKKAGFGPGTSTRLKEQTTSVGLEVIEQLAVAFKVQPWHLLVPDLDIENLPADTPGGGAWPFQMVDRLAYEALPLEDRAFVQGYMARTIEERTRQGNRRAA